MAKLSRQTKETIKTIIVLLIVGLLFTFYAIYPLNNTDTLFARVDIENYNIDSLAQNEVGPFTNPSWIVNTLRIEPDALTSLACLYIQDSLSDTVLGTVILIPSADSTRDTQLPLVEELIKKSYICITFDLRATGLSSGKYHGFGSLEATDLQEIISYLDIHSQIKQPLYIVGTGLGADAAILSASEDSRIKKVIAIEPMLTTENMIATAKEKYGSIWFPFYNSVMYWWYEMNSGYSPTYIAVEDITAISCQTILIANNNNELVKTLQNISDPKILTIVENKNEPIQTIIRYIHE